MQEMHVVEKGCANMDTDSKIKQSVNGQNYNNNVNTLTNYFLSSPNVEADKRKSIELPQKYAMQLEMCLMELGASKAHFLCGSSPIANCIKCHQGVWHMHYRNHLRRG